MSKGIPALPLHTFVRSVYSGVFLSFSVTRPRKCTHCTCIRFRRCTQFSALLFFVQTLLLLWLFTFLLQFKCDNKKW